MLEELLIVKPAIKGKLLKNAPLSPYTSWRTGGCADFIFLPHDLADMQLFLQAMPTHLPLTCLGLGSNTLIRDGGIEGIVIITQGSLTQLKMLNSLEIRAEAGVACAQLARFSARLHAKGLSFMAGIPGTIGGALAMNAGCFGGETWQWVKMVETINRKGMIQIRSKNDFTIAYRHVSKIPNEWFVAGHFSLQPGEKNELLNEIRNLLAKRNASQPTGLANCGSVFKNPQGGFAGQLIETCGLKGKAIGQARVSDKHANFIINEGDAKSQDIENLIYEISTIVEQKTGVRLIPEVCIIGREK